jgi:riboflavin kinase
MSQDTDVPVPISDAATLRTVARAQWGVTGTAEAGGDQDDGEIPSGRDTTPRAGAEAGTDSGPATATPTGPGPSDLASRLDVGPEATGRAVDRLADRGLLERTGDPDGGVVALTAAGKRALWREYAAYRRLFDDGRGVRLAGTVTTGLGRGSQFVSMRGYREQFRSQLGYDPFPGTLNVSLRPASVRARVGLDLATPIRIDGWRDGDRTYGAVDCYPATITAPGGDGRVDRAHLVVPVRTDHDEGELELLAPVELRTELGLADGDPVTVAVETEAPTTGADAGDACASDASDGR